MKKRISRFMFVFAALVSVFVIAGCDINNPIIDGWWVGETPKPAAAITAFTIRFDVQGGNYIDLINDPLGSNTTDAPPEQRVEAGQASVYEPGLVVNTTTPFFSGWYTEPGSGGVKWNFNKTLVSVGYDRDGDGIITLYARWEGTGKEVKFALNAPPGSNITGNDTTYYSSNGNISGLPLPEKIASGVEMSRPKGFGLTPGTPPASGYIFTGWYTTSECTSMWDFTKPVTENMTLHAGWGKKTGEVVVPPGGGPSVNVYTVNFESDGKVTSYETAISGDLVSSPIAIYKKGYVFSAWYKDSSFTEKWDFAKDVADESYDMLDGNNDNVFTMYARWELEPYSDPWFDERYVPADPAMPFYPFQCEPGYDDFGDYDHVGGDANYDTNWDNYMKVIELLKDNPTWVARIVGYEDSAGDDMDAKREKTSWYLLWTETGVGDKQLIINTKLPQSVPSDYFGGMIIGNNDSEGVVGPDGHEIKVYIYKPKS